MDSYSFHAVFKPNTVAKIVEFDDIAKCFRGFLGLLEKNASRHFDGVGLLHDLEFAFL